MPSLPTPIPSAQDEWDRLISDALDAFRTSGQKPAPNAQARRDQLQHLLHLGNRALYWGMMP